jgi:hypothetical protein
MPADNELDPLDHWLNQQVRPLPPPPGTFELISKRARRRKIRKAVISVASAAAVAAVVGVAVPIGMSLHLNTTSTSGNLAAEGSSPGRTGGATHSTMGKATEEPSPAASSGAASAPASVAPTSSSTAAGGYLPPDYVPSSVTWDSLSTGWVLGPAGTPGHCANANPDVCTSIARTDDGGQTWHGVPAPPTTGVTGLRFLNATYGWAYGPQLWATDDGGDHWHQVATGTLSVPQLETINGRAYALFADCRSIDGNPDAACTSYTLKTATAGSDDWTTVGGVPGGLTGGSADLTQAAGQQDAAILELTGATGTQPATGYLVAPDGTLYAGPLDGTAWHQVAPLPCAPGPGNGSGGEPQALRLTPDGLSSAGAVRLAMVCTQTTTGSTATSLYLSNDSGVTWTQQAGVKSMPATSLPESLTSLPDGTLILAAVANGGGTSGGVAGSGLSGGIYLLSPGATQWAAATLSAAPAWKTPVGFTYVGMTSATQGVALSGDPSQHAIWMTTDGGQTWQARPIQG